MNIKQKETLKNRTLAQVAINMVIRDFIRFAYTDLQDMWKMKKDGTFYKNVQESIDIRLEFFVQMTKEYMLRHHKVDIQGLTAYVGSGFKGHGSNQKCTLRVSARYCDVSTRVEPEWHTQGNYMYIGKSSPEWRNADDFFELNQKYIEDQKEKYPIVSIREAMSAQRHYMRLKKKIEVLQQQRRDFAYNFGSEYLTNNI